MIRRSLSSRRCLLDTDVDILITSELPLRYVSFGHPRKWVIGKTGPEGIKETPGNAIAVYSDLHEAAPKVMRGIYAEITASVGGKFLAYVYVDWDLYSQGLNISELFRDREEALKWAMKTVSVEEIKHRS